MAKGKPWPHDSHAKMVNAGYLHQGNSPCSGCGCNVLWYRTPTGHNMPMERMSDGRLQPHFASCKNVGDFRLPDVRKRQAGS